MMMMMMMQRSLYPVSINEMPAPEAVFAFIKISYKIFYNRFRVITQHTVRRYESFTA